MHGPYKHWKASNKNGASVRTKTKRLVQLRADATAALLVHANDSAHGTCLGPWHDNGSPEFCFSCLDHPSSYFKVVLSQLSLSAGISGLIV